MDNDNKIMIEEEQRHKEVLLFLQDELEPLKLKNNASSYNLEQEYAKTRKNKSPFVPLMLCGCVLVVALVAFILSKQIEKTNREVVVNVAEFDDVNLKNLIDTVARTQDQYEAAVKNKIQIETQKKGLLNAAADKRDGDLVTIQSLNLRDKKDKANREAVVQQEYEKTVKEINSEYDPIIEEANVQIEIYKEKLDEYDNSKLAAAQEQQKALDSERALQELERKQMAQAYESRITSLEETISRNRKTYQEEMRKSLKSVSDKLQAEIDALDPVIKDAKADEVMNSPSLNNRRLYDVENHEVFIAGNISDNDLATRMSGVRKMYQDFKYLDKKILDLPHKFTIGKIKEADDKLVDQITDEMADSVYGLYKDKVSLKQEIVTLKENIEKMKKDHEAEVQSLNREREEAVAAEKAAGEETLYSVMQGAGFSALIDSAASIEEIYVLVRPNARYLVSEEKGCVAEIPFKKVIKGTVWKTSDGKFRFEPEKDKSGNYVSFDLSSLVRGVQVKLK